MERFLEQAKDYEGRAVGYAWRYDQYDEEHFILVMQVGAEQFYWLDWIGGEYAPEPDEFSEPPFDNLEWRAIPEIVVD